MGSGWGATGGGRARSGDHGAGIPRRHRLGQAGAQGGPLGEEVRLMDRGGAGLAGLGEFPVRDLEQLGQVYFFRVLAQQGPIQDQLGGVAFFLDVGFELPINRAGAQDGVHVDVALGVQAPDPVDGLDEFVHGPGIGNEDDIVAAVERVALGHAVDAGEKDGDLRFEI